MKTRALVVSLLSAMVLAGSGMLSSPDAASTLNVEVQEAQIGLAVYKMTRDEIMSAIIGGGLGGASSYAGAEVGAKIGGFAGGIAGAAAGAIVGAL